MGTLRNRIIELAFAGDEVAQSCMVDAVPDELPDRVTIRFRNVEIRAIAAWLRSLVPEISDRRIARLLEAAGDALASRRGLAMLPAGASLTRDEMIILRHRLEPLLGTDRPWPRQRMLRNILAEGVGNTPPISIARDAA
jgi:hypothetical protein